MIDIYTVGDMKQMILIWWWEVFDTREEYLEVLQWYSVDPYKIKKRRRSWLIHALYWHYECFEPQMPNKHNADYAAWKIWFEKYFGALNTNECDLVWSSLGGIFLLKRLSENTFPKRVAQLHLVAPVSSNEWLIDEVIWNFEFNFDNLTNLTKQCDKIYVYHSVDDPVVPYSQTEKLMKYLPWAILEKFNNRWHFKQPAFPELLDNIWIYTR